MPCVPDRSSAVVEVRDTTDVEVGRSQGSLGAMVGSPRLFGVETYEGYFAKPWPRLSVCLSKWRVEFDMCEFSRFECELWMKAKGTHTTASTPECNVVILEGFLDGERRRMGIHSARTFSRSIRPEFDNEEQILTF